MRINYAFMVVAITVMVSQLYVQLGEFSNSLLLVRLEETALGAGVVIAVVTLVLPLRTRRVLRVAFCEHVQTVGTPVDHASSRLVGAADTESALRADARVVEPPTRPCWPRLSRCAGICSVAWTSGPGRAMRLASASRDYSRNLIGDLETSEPLDKELWADIERASTALRGSLDVVAGALTGTRDGVYTRSSALFDRAERLLEERSASIDEGQLAIRDLKLIDGAVVQMAEASASGSSTTTRSGSRSRQGFEDSPDQPHDNARWRIDPAWIRRRRSDRAVAGRPPVGRDTWAQFKDLGVGVVNSRRAVGRWRNVPIAEVAEGPVGRVLSTNHRVRFPQECPGSGASSQRTSQAAPPPVGWLGAEVRCRGWGGDEAPTTGLGEHR
jgi:hypothetical protein